MKTQRFELSHDLIAEKIWERMPKQDQTLRSIQRSLAQRQQDFQEGRGSLLGEAELEGWKLFLSSLDISEAQKQFFEESFQDYEKKKNVDKLKMELIERLGNKTIITLLVASVFSLILTLELFSTKNFLLASISFLLFIFLVSSIALTMRAIIDFENSTDQTQLVSGWNIETFKG